MKRRKNPFGEITPKIVPVCKTGDASGNSKAERTVYFGSYGCLTPNISPVDLQEQEKRQVEVTILLFAAAKRLAEKLNISEEEARSHYFPRVVNGVEIAPRNFLDDLNDEQQLKVLMLQREGRELDIKVATIFMQHRLAYDLVVEEPTFPLMTTMKVQEPWFEVQPGDRFKFDSCTITITSPYDSTMGTVGVQPITVGLESNSVGFLLKKDGGYVLGDRSWEEEDTRNLLSTRVNPGDPPGQIQEIYAFYLKEVGRNDEASEVYRGDTPPGELREEVGFSSNGKGSSSTETPPALTGEASTGNSNGLVAMTSDSDMILMGNAQNG